MTIQPCLTKSPTAGVQQQSPAVVIAANRLHYWDKMFDVDAEDQSRATVAHAHQTPYWSPLGSCSALYISSAQPFHLSGCSRLSQAHMNK